MIEQLEKQGKIVDGKFIKPVEESVCLKECVVDLYDSKYDVEIMDGTHIRMKAQGSDKWGIALHYMQVPPEVIYQLKQQGYAKGQFFVADQDRYKKEHEPIPTEELKESIAKITKVTTTHHKDNNQTITYVDWVDNKGKTGSTSGDPNSTHIKELINRAKREKAEIINESEEAPKKEVPSKYKVWSLDVVGNETDGWEVNDRSEAGMVTLNDSLEGQTADDEVVDALKASGLLNDKVTSKDLVIDMPDDMIINVDDGKTGKFLYTLEKEGMDESVKYGAKSDYPKIDIYSGEAYRCSTTQAKSVKDAIEKYKASCPDDKNDIKAHYSKGK
jgi:hypothetical protein